MLWYITLTAVLLAGTAGGFLGSIVGLGGAFIIVPVLTLILGVPIQYAAGAALIAAIATSSGAASAYLRDGVSNIRIGMSLEVGTTLGAIAGSLIAAYVYTHGLSSYIFILFGLVLLSSATLELAFKRGGLDRAHRPDATTKIFHLKGTYHSNTLHRDVRYNGVRWHVGQCIMVLAGVLSGLLGIGAGVLKVVALEIGMGLPTRVSTATSNFMIGVTAAASSIVYWELGYIQPFIAGATAVGVLVGAYAGARVFKRMRGGTVSRMFAVLAIVLAAEMIASGVGI